MKRILLAVKEEIKRGWCQGHYAMSDGRVADIQSGKTLCLIGALVKVTGFSRYTVTDQMPKLREFGTFLAEKVNLGIDTSLATTDYLLIGSNDSAEMTQERMVNLIDEYLGTLE